jgi:hypothetical protein
VLFSGVKAGTGGGGREFNHLSASSFEIKREWRPTSVPHIHLHGVEREKCYLCLQGHGSSRGTQTGISINWFVKALAKWRRLS